MGEAQPHGQNPGDLGPTTERRFAEAFARSALATRKAAAELLGVSVHTLDALTDEGLIRAVRRGKLRAYVERDLRAYLTEGATECPSIVRKASASGCSTSNTRVVDFTARPARLRVVPPRPSSASAASKRRPASSGPSRP